MTSDVIAVEQNLSTRGRMELGDQVKAGALAGSVGADDGVNGVALDFQVDIIDGHKAQKLLGQAFGLDHKVGRVRHECLYNLRSYCDRPQTPQEKPATSEQHPDALTAGQLLDG